MLLCDGLSTFEMAHRGFFELSETIEQMIEFAAIVSHELRTPLTSLTTSVGLLRELRPLDAEARERQLLENIERSTLILKERTDDLLDLAAFQSGRHSVKPESVAVGAIISDLVKQMRPAASGAGVELRVKGCAARTYVRVDPMRTRQVLGNLVNNAIQYGGEDRVVDLRWYRDGSRRISKCRTTGTEQPHRIVPSCSDRGTEVIERTRTSP